MVVARLVRHGGSRIRGRVARVDRDDIKNWACREESAFKDDGGGGCSGHLDAVRRQLAIVMFSIALAIL